MWPWRFNRRRIVVRTAFINIILALLLVIVGVVQSQERQPVSIALDSETGHVYVANRDSGSITTVNLEARSIVGERKVGQQLSCLTAVPGSTRFLATDEQANELLLGCV